MKAEEEKKKSVIYPIAKVGRSELTEPLGSIIVERIVILSLSSCCYDLTVLSPRHHTICAKASRRCIGVTW